MQAKLAIKNLTTSPESWFGLEYSEVKYESVPLIIGPQRKTLSRTKESFINRRNLTKRLSLSP